eukprot:9329411-Alexandrium_andersonii.AAC.1
MSGRELSWGPAELGRARRFLFLRPRPRNSTAVSGHGAVARWPGMLLREVSSRRAAARPHSGDKSCWQRRRRAP